MNTCNCNIQDPLRRVLLFGFLADRQMVFPI
jgi:hypothetical protein